MPRPGFVLEVDKSTPPILFWRGENFSLEKLPAGRSRVIYAPEPLPAIEDVDGAIRHALLNPIEQDPLPEQMFPGMKLTIAFDDVSLPLPKMERPDIRQRVIEAVLDMAAEAGVDDVHIIKDNLFETPPLFSIIQEESGTDWKEMYKVFNMGHRMEMYVPEEIATSIIAISKSFGVDAQIVGRVEAADKKKLTIASTHGTFYY